MAAVRRIISACLFPCSGSALLTKILDGALDFSAVAARLIRYFDV